MARRKIIKTPQPTYRMPSRPRNPHGHGWSLALPAAPLGNIGYAGHWRTKEDAETAFADPKSPYYGGFYNGTRGRLTNTQDWGAE